MNHEKPDAFFFWKLPSVRLQKMGDRPAGKPAIHLTVLERRQYHLFAAIQIITGMFVTIVAVHLLTLLQARGLSLAEAVAFGAFIGRLRSPPVDAIIRSGR